MPDVTEQYKDAPLFPIKLFIYNEDGTYGNPFKISNESVLHSDFVKDQVRMAITKKVEIRMTDPFDNLVFHAVNGEILFPV